MDWLGFGAVPSLGDTSPSRGVRSPWASDIGSRIVLGDLYGLNIDIMTRSEAMAIPAVARARHLICGTLARQPLRAYKDGVVVEDQPTWLTRTDSVLGPRMRMLYVLDDLFFYGWALLGVQRGSEGQILDGWRIPPEQWKFDAKGQVLVNDVVASSNSVILIPGMSAGLLAEGGRTIRGARLLEEQWTARVKNPIPSVEIRYTGEEDLTPDEIAQIRQDYITARDDINGTVMVTPRGFEVVPHGDNAVELFVEGRNATAVDVARFANIPMQMLDAAATNESSVTYENQMVSRSSFIDTTLRTWALPVEEALSGDSVTPRGTTIAFDLNALVAPDTGIGPTLED